MRNSKTVQASSELNFSLLEIDLCLSLILSLNLKHILTNEAAKHDGMGDYFICVVGSIERLWRSTAAS